MLARIFVAIGVSFLLHGCALTDAALDVGPDATLIGPGPLSEVGELSFSMGDMQDMREDKERVGYKKNGFGQNMGSITTAEPVPTVVGDAIAAAMVANGHSPGDGGVSINGAVTNFWMETDINFTNIEMSCNINVDLGFADANSGEEIYSSDYSASYSDKKQMGTEGNFQEIINGALQALADEIVFDAELAEALASR